MKKYNSLLLLIISVLVFTACEDVIDLDVPEIEPRLVVQGGMTTQELQEIKLTFSADYFNQNAPIPASGAKVEVRDASGNSFLFEETPSASGVYTFGEKAKVGEIYTLFIELSNGKKYQSKPETLFRVSEITALGYIKDDGFGNDSDSNYVVLLSAIEPQDTRDFYRWKIYRNDTLLSEPEDLSFARDDFVNEQVVAIELYRGNDIGEGDLIRVEQLSITEGYYEYLNTLFQQTAFRGGIFDTPPAPIIGNVFSVEDPDESALGYFNASAIEDAEVEIVD